MKRATKFAFLCPDDLSAWIFLKPFLTCLKKPDVESTILAPIVYDYRNSLIGLGANYIEVPMIRYINPIKDLIYILSVRKALTKIDPDFIVSFTTKPNLFSCLSVSSKKPKICLAIRGLGGIFDEAASSLTKILRNIASFLYKKSCKRSDIVWFTNEEDRDFFLKNSFVTPDKVFLTKNAIDISFYNEAAVNQDAKEQISSELKIDRQRPVIVMVARLIYSKGINEFIVAAELLKDRISAEFVLVAPDEVGHPDRFPKDKLDKALADGFIKWIPFTHNIRELYSLSSLAVLPSYYREGGYPRALLEPMAMGKPVIAADTPYCRGPISDSSIGLLVPPKNPAALADAIEQILKNPDETIKMGKAARKHIEENFDDQVVCRKVLSRLKEI